MENLVHRRLLLLAFAAVLLLGVALGSLAVATAHADSVGALQVNGTLKITFSSVECPVGTPTTTNCYGFVTVGDGVVPGLGIVTTRYTFFYDDFGAPCGHVHAQIAFLVGGKGEIDLTTRTAQCLSHGEIVQSSDVTVSGGSGKYTGASGGGVLGYRLLESGPGTGTGFITWTGTLNVAGLTFDTTPPQIAGATAKAVKTRLAKGARVRYSVSAADATDGPVAAACLPKSGSVLRVGRTTVTCTAVDSSGNTARARFVITVKRGR
jgi:hypothetical protein